MSFSGAPFSGVAFSGPASALGQAFTILPVAGHANGASLAIEVTYSGGASAPSSGAVPLSIQSGAGAITAGSWIQDSSTTGHFTFTEGAVSGTPTVFLDSVTSTTQSFSNAAVVPNAPTGLTLTDNHNGTITANYTQATDAGGSSITGNSILSSNGDTGTAGSPGAPITFTPTNGLAITVQVRAINAVAPGAYSSASSPITPDNHTVSLFFGRAPFLRSDTIGTKQFQKYDIESGVLTAVDGAITSGFVAIPNVTNGWALEMSLTPNGLYEDSAYISVLPNINTVISAAIECNTPPRSTPAAVVQCKIAPFPASIQIGDIVAHTLSLSAASVGTGRTLTAGSASFAGTSADIGKVVCDIAGIGRAIITAPTDTTHCTATIIDAFSGTSLSSSGWTLGKPGYQLYDIGGNAVGSRVTSGILPIPAVQGGYVTRLSVTPDVDGGVRLTILWDSGAASPVYYDDLVISNPLASAAVSGGGPLVGGRLIG